MYYGDGGCPAPRHVESQGLSVPPASCSDHRDLSFAFALPFFCNRIKSFFDRKGGSAEASVIPSIDGGSFFGKQHSMAKNNSHEP
jgi:hypothetical protein